MEIAYNTENKRDFAGEIYSFQVTKPKIPPS